MSRTRSKGFHYHPVAIAVVINPEQKVHGFFFPAGGDGTIDAKNKREFIWYFGIHKKLNGISALIRTSSKNNRALYKTYETEIMLYYDDCAKFQLTKLARLCWSTLI